MKKKTQILLPVIFFLFLKLANAQTEADFLNLLFKHPINPKDSLLYKEVETVAELNNYYEELFPFPTHTFYSAYERVKVSSLQSLSDTLRYVNVTLAGKTVRSHCYFKGSTGNLRTAIFIIPGSGHNQSGDIYRNTTGNYHNYPVPVSESYRSLGDVYTYIKPNEDILAIHRKGKKLDWYSVYAHLLNQGTSYSSNYLTQCLGFIKVLKSNYDRVLIVGLSQGGYASLILSLMSEPTGSVVASGYSIMIENEYYADLNQIIIDDIGSTFNKEKIYSIINNNSTYYLFSWGVNENAYYGLENNTLLTYNYFKDTGKVDFYNQNYGHTYPSKAKMEDFFMLNNERPMISFRQETDCKNLQEIITLKSVGEFPFSFMIENPSGEKSEYTVTQPIDTLKNFTEGTYIFSNPRNTVHESIYRKSVSIKDIEKPNALTFRADDFEYDFDDRKWNYKPQSEFVKTIMLINSHGDSLIFKETSTVSLPNNYYPKVILTTEGDCVIEKQIDLLLEKPYIGYFPNPIADQLNIEINLDFVHSNSVSAIIRDAFGKDKGTYALTYGQNQIDFSEQPSGIYFIEVRNSYGNLGVQIFKIVKK